MTTEWLLIHKPADPEGTFSTAITFPTTVDGLPVVLSIVDGRIKQVYLKQGIEIIASAGGIFACDDVSVQVARYRQLELPNPRANG